MQPAEIITEKSYSLSVRNAQKQSSIIDSSLCNVITTSSVNKIHWICPSDAMKKKKKLHPAYGKCFLLIYKISAADGRCILADENEKSGMEKRGTVAARLHLLFTLDKTFSDLVRGIQFNRWGEFGEALTLFQSWRSSQGISEKRLATNVGRCYVIQTAQSFGL